MSAAANINITAYSDALVVLGTSAVLIPLFRRRGINPVLGYLAAGAVLGPFGLGSFINQLHFLYWFTIVDPANVSEIAELGIVFLLFVIGLELSTDRLTSMRRLVGGLGSLQVIISGAALTGLLTALGQPLPAAIVLGASLSLSSTAIVLEILTRQKRLSTGLGQASFAILLAQDIAAIPILMFVSLSGVNSGGSVLHGLLRAFLQAAVAVAVIVLAGRFLMRPLFRMVAGTHSTELFIAAVLFVVIGAAVVAHEAGLSMALGAFIAGLLLAETEFRNAIEANIDPFKGLLLGVFFFTVGMRVDIRELVHEPLLLLACVCALIAIKAIILTGLARLFRLSWSASIESGLLLGPGGEFAFVVLGLAADMNLITPHTSGLALAVTSVSMATTPALSFAAGKIRRALANSTAQSPELSVSPGPQANHAIVIGFGRVGKVVCELLREESVNFIAVDSDPQAVIADREQGHQVFFGDASDPGFLHTCGLDKAIGVVITMSAISTVDSIVAHVRSHRPEIPIVVRARDASHACHLYAIGASNVVPETIEASLQLSEAALLGMGVNPSSAVSAIQQRRKEFQRELQCPAPVQDDPPNSH